tara:strand:- start:1559 stop:1894 length:336 start_codon:yes stop_codon:yes gene_type:complete
MTFRGYVSGQKGKKFPDRWKWGPSNDKRIVNRWYLMAKAQARFRKEEWALTFADYWNFWADNMEKRGRTENSYVMARIDCSKPWHKKNIILKKRRDAIVDGKAQREAMEKK